jgi:Ca2+-binding EF-hand superfamily protein
MSIHSPRAFPSAAGLLLLAIAAVPAGTSFAQAPATTATAHFESLDTNKDGLVSKGEYESSGAFAQLDENHDNRISAAELEDILGPQEDGTPSAADRIRVADSNNDGELTDEELRRNAEMQFTRLDGNNDGHLDLAEMKSGFGIPVVPR